MKLAIIQQVYPHYRVCIFDQINEQYDLRLFHGIGGLGLNSIMRDYSILGNSYKFFKFNYLSYIVRILQFRPKVIIQEFALSFLNLYVSFIISRLIGAKFIVWGHVLISSPVDTDNFDLKKRLINWFIRKSDAVIVYNDDTRIRLIEWFGANKVFTARNSIDSKELMKTLAGLELLGREKQRSTMGFISKLHLCFVSRVSERKRVDLLPALVEILIKDQIDVHVHVVGDGPCLDSLKKLVAAGGLTDRFTLYGAVYDESEVGRIIYCSDFMIIPGWLGLSANHSMCYGTPVITLSTMPHPPEIEYVKDGVNGLLADSLNSIPEKIREFYSYDEYQALRASTTTYYRQYLSINTMFSGFNDAIEFVRLPEKSR